MSRSRSTELTVFVVIHVEGGDVCPKIFHFGEARQLSICRADDNMKKQGKQVQQDCCPVLSLGSHCGRTALSCGNTRLAKRNPEIRQT